MPMPTAALPRRWTARTLRFWRDGRRFPVELAVELQTNPFLRADDPALRAAMGLPDAPAEAVFAAIRAAKDTF